MSDFGRDDPRAMPAFLFRDVVGMDYASAVRADPEKQNCSICPRYWYVTATFRCARCARDFDFTATEQRVWYEEYGFWIDSLPRHCLDCRRALRQERAARRTYDREIEAALRGDDVERKRRLAAVIDELCELGGELPPRLSEKRRRLARQLERAGEAGRA
jgi:hypothetical protein